ncbi:MAG: ribbon-helix-helix protein, CopG family [Sulfolobales archaeon]
MKSKKLKIISFKIDEKDLQALDRYAESNGISRSEVIRRALYKIISTQNSNENNDHEIKILRREISILNESGDSNIVRKNSNMRKNKIEIILRE